MSADQNDQKRQHISPRPTPLSRHARHKKTLHAPVKQLKNLSFSAWVEDGLPDVLWAALILHGMARENAFAFFRELLTILKKNKNQFDKDFLLTHSQLATLRPAQFDLLFGSVREIPEIRRALSPLLVLQNLPEREHWSRHLETLDEGTCWTDLAAAVAEVFDHQSQSATDCRWVKLMCLFALDRMVVDRHLVSEVDNILRYPDEGDMRQVRPSIRAMEMMTRGVAGGDDSKPRSSWLTEFWSECWDRTLCTPIDPDDRATAADHRELFSKIVEIDRRLTEHFLGTLTTTGINPRHDATFGLAFYCVHLIVFALKAAVGQTLQGRLVLGRPWRFI